MIAVVLLVLAQADDAALEKLRAFYAREPVPKAVELATVEFDVTRDTLIVVDGEELGEPDEAELPVGRRDFRLINRRLGVERTVRFEVKPGKNYFTYRLRP